MNILKIVRLLFLAGVISALAAINCAHAEGTSGSGQYEALKAKYTTLRNTDPAIHREKEWRALAKEFENLAAKRDAGSDGPSAYYHAALLKNELYAVREDSDDADDAARLFAIVANRYPTSSLAGDALLRMGEVLGAEGERSSARAVYERIRRDRPDSDLSAIAAQREFELDHGRSHDSGKNTGSLPANTSGSHAVVVLDPGHGGEDLGAQGQGGLLEKDVTLAVATDTAAILAKDVGAIVRLTRRDDTFVPLANRTNYANDTKADIFVSLHANASPLGTLSGIETYILDNSNDKSSKLLAERENASAQAKGGTTDLQFMLSDLMESSKLGASKKLAVSVQDAIMHALSHSYGSVKSLGVKKAPFYVLVDAHMPSILVEMSFIDNAQDGKLLADKKYRHTLATGIASGIEHYLQTNRRPK